jgi:hypothetical protein
LPRANKAEDEGREEELDKIVSEIELVERKIEEMSQAIKAAENLSRNAGLD